MSFVQSKLLSSKQSKLLSSKQRELLSAKQSALIAAQSKRDVLEKSHLLPQLEWSEWPITKPVKDKYALSFDEQTQDNLQADFDFFGTDNEIGLIEVREGKGWGYHQERDEFENNIAIYKVTKTVVHDLRKRHVFILQAVNLVTTEKPAIVIKPKPSSRPELTSKTFTLRQKRQPFTSINMMERTTSKSPVANNDEAALSKFLHRETKFWYGKGGEDGTIEDSLKQMSNQTNDAPPSVLLTSWAELLFYATTVANVNTDERPPITYRPASFEEPETMTAAEKQAGLDKIIAMGMRRGWAADEEVLLYISNETHPAECMCGCQRYSKAHFRGCRCGCGWAVHPVNRAYY